MHKYLNSDTLITKLIYFALFAVPLAFSYSFMEAFYLPKRVVLNCAVCLVAAISICSSIRNSRQREKVLILITPVNILLCLYLLWTFITIFISPNFWVSLDSYIFLTSNVVMFFAVLFYINTKQKVIVLLNIIVFAASIVSALGIMEYFGHDIESGFTTMKMNSDINKYSIISTIGHPNFLAVYLISVFPISTIFVFINKGLKKWLYLMSSLLILSCIYVSQSKGAWLGLLVSLIVLISIVSILHKDYLFQIKKKIGIMLVSFILLLSLMAFLFPKVLSPMKKVKNTLSLKFGGNVARIIIWNSTLKMIKDRPITGVGTGAYNLFYQSYQADFLNSSDNMGDYMAAYRPGKEAHNDYLQIAAETGIFGLLLFLSILIVCFKNGWALLKIFVNQNDGYILLALIVGISAILTHSMVSFPLLQVPPTLHLWTFLAIIMGTPFRNKMNLSGWRIHEFDHLITIEKKTFSYPVKFIVWCLAFYFIFISSMKLYSSSLNKKALKKMLKNDFRTAIPIIKESVKWNSTNPDLLLLLGAAYHQTNQLKAASEAYEESFKYNPDYMILYNLGLIAETLGDVEKARIYYHKAVWLHPSLLEGYDHLANIYKQRGAREKFLENDRKRKKYALKK